MKKGCALLMTCLLFALAQTESLAAALERSTVPVSETWNLTDLYATKADWETEKTEWAGKIDHIKTYQDKLSESADQLLACLEFTSNLSREFGQLYSYASMLADQDTRESAPQAMKQELQQLATNFQALASYIEPEIVAMKPETIAAFLKEEPGLEVYRHYLDNLQRQREHTLTAAEEKIVAQAGLMSGAAAQIFNIFSNADLPYPQVTLTTGETVLLNPSGFGRYRAVTNREDREKVFNAFFGALNTFRRTFGTQLDGNLKKDLFYARVRNYPSTLAAALDANNIPVEVYHSLIQNVNENLDTFYRYLQLKQRMLGVDTLKYSDLYAPVVADIELNYTLDQAQEMILEAMAPLGGEYVQILQKAFNERWIDFHPTLGKRSGAYSNGSVYDVHPYILMNFNGQYNDVSTLAHELGHSLHSFFANKTQPFPTADYPIFVAEVASTLNEALLIHKQLELIQNDGARLSLLMNYLDGIKGTVFRQTQFAEYELRIHEAVEKGIPLTGDKLTEIYADIVRTYYGHDRGVCQVDDLYTIEWAYIPHFYYNYYVYQYATSFTASTALSQKILSGDSEAVQKTIAFLSAGGSDYPIELLKKAGVDLTTSAPFAMTMQAMNQTMDEIERILDSQGR
ncbi:oligoendopeptidase F [candidate division KSB1 bacterium]|nr:oligoendopeptidase F [candidate division KSB1 bacterium]